MKVTGKTYNVELTEAEVNTLVKVLEDEYKYRAKTPEIRELRNAFADIINRHYMGEDA